jgi:hypothetical protein
MPLKLILPASKKSMGVFWRTSGSRLFRSTAKLVLTARVTMMHDRSPETSFARPCRRTGRLPGRQLRFAENDDGRG